MEGNGLTLSARDGSVLVVEVVVCLIGMKGARGHIRSRLRAQTILD